MAQVEEAMPQALELEGKNANADNDDNAVGSQVNTAEKAESKDIICLDNDDETDAQADKLDELSSLEQEIAKMHNISVEAELELTIPEVTGSRRASDNASVENGKTKAKEAEDHGEPCSPLQTDSNSGKATALDLIALLKGTDTTITHITQQQQQLQEHQEEDEGEQKSSIELALAELDNVGVTIEGEGQYEIMEIDDEDGGIEIAMQSSPKPAPAKSHSKPKAKLSPEQARAVALEQMANLKSKGARRKEAAAVALKPQDIISSLNDDWNEYDSDSASSSLPSNQIKLPIKKIKPVVNVTKEPPPPPPPAAEEPTTGFKRTRIIKRKIIWDPDVPETQKSYSQYASTKPAPQPAPSEAPARPATPASTSIVVTVAKKEPAPKKPRVVIAKAQNPALQVKSVLAPAKRPITPKPAKAAAVETPPTSPTKRRSQTPSTTALSNGSGSGSGGGAAVKKKKVSEIDRLMGDEGAANMIHAVEHEQRELSADPDHESSVHKPVMRKRALTITVRPPARAAEQQHSPTVRKDAGATSSPPKATKKSTAASAAAVNAVFAKSTTNTAAKQRPSDSWDYVYKQRASDESMIMRRRSNSSYSSNASVNRLSLDNKQNANLSDEATESNDPSFKFLKPENKASQRSGGGGQTLAADLKRGAASPKSDLISIQKLEKVALLTINTHRAKVTSAQSQFTYHLQLLKQLTETLNKVAKSNDCNTVALSIPQGEEQFCQGIDLQELIANSVEKRKNVANQISTALKTYLKTLSTFPKPLVVGLVGNLKNLGVMQLPLLDYVVAADDCSFETNYAKIGQLPEGYAFWHNHPKVDSSVHSNLFLLGHRLDCLEMGSLIQSVTKNHDVHQEVLEVAKRISTNTAENYRQLKKLNHIPVIVSAASSRLDEEFKIIAEQWATPSCQASFKRHLNDVDGL